MAGRLWYSRRALAVTIGVGGFALCWLLDAAYGGKVPSLGATALDLIVSLVFWLVALLVAARTMGRTTALILVVLLALLTWASYREAWGGTGSTAGLSVLIPLVVGVPCIFVAAMVDGVLREVRSRRTRRGATSN